MKRSITRWTMAVATAGVLSLPVSSFARTTQDPQPQPQQQQPPAQPQPQPQQPQPQPEQPAPTPQQPAPTPQQPTATPPQQPTATPSTQAEKEMTPQDHLKKAQEAAKEISTMSVPAKDRGNVEQLKKHLSNLDKASSSSAAAPTETAKKGEAKSSAQPNWGTEVAAIDKLITEMVGSESATPAAPKPTGTSGSSATLDDATRAKLMEVRTHITAYAAGMAGTSTPKTEAAAAPESPAARPEPTMTEPAAQSPAPAASPAPAQNPPAQSPSPSPAQQPDPNAAQPPAAQPSPASQQPPAQGQVDTEAAHRHLLTARETLAQLTQLPAAAQLSGEARNQVSQLITNFNELITTQSNWKASYDKVNANLTTLLGPDNSDNEAMGGAPTANAGATPTPNAGATPAPTPGATPAPNAGAATPGAVGTAGTASVELDPSIRAKLVELRKNLNDFKKAAGAGQ